MVKSLACTYNIFQLLPLYMSLKQHNHMCEKTLAHHEQRLYASRVVFPFTSPRHSRQNHFLRLDESDGSNNQAKSCPNATLLGQVKTPTHTHTHTHADKDRHTHRHRQTHAQKKKFSRHYRDSS